MVNKPMKIILKFIISQENASEISSVWHLSDL